LRISWKAGGVDDIRTDMKSEENLRNALRQIPISDYAAHIADILYEFLNSSSDIPYVHIRRLAGENAEDVILIASERRLIIPAGKDLSWKSSEYLFGDEKYYIPWVVREAAKRACGTGLWEPEYAIHAYFKRIKEPLWGIMPQYFNEIKRNARYGKISGKEIKGIASRFKMGTEDKIGVLIAEFKAAGLINPHFSFVLGLKEKDVTYELHPCF